ncbi:MAG: hypothetical protein PHP51_06920 [Desulfotomaculaceae bacterium]|nr:hypothetical protein [Desulfotomaculaceae bacterium]
MAPLIHEGKYQVLEVFEERDGFKCYLCIDVETNNHYKAMVFNIYEKPQDIRWFLPLFFDLNREQFTDFIRVMSGRHNITAVFAYHQGVKLREFFKEVNVADFEQRCSYASKLLEQCLILDAAPDFIAFSCLEPDHIVILDKSQKVAINYIIRPQKNYSDKFKGRKLATLLECIFVKDRYVPAGLWEYIGNLRKSESESIVTAFSRWKEINEELLKEHRKLKKEALPAYLLRRLKQQLKRQK